MNKEIAEWIFIADEDIRSADLLNSAYRPNNESICWHCSQAIEKYLKGYLLYNNKDFDWNHNLSSLIEKCSILDSSFKPLEEPCKTITFLTKNVRYPKRTEITRNTVYFTFETLENIINLKPIQLLKNNIIKEYGENWKEVYFYNNIKELIESLKCFKYDNSKEELLDYKGNKIKIEKTSIISENENICKMQYKDENGIDTFILQRTNEGSVEKWHFKENFNIDSAINFIFCYDREKKYNKKHVNDINDSRGGGKGGGSR